MADDQSETIAFLSSPAAYGRPGENVERVDTHISVVFLVGDRAYKLKRAVTFDYVDFSTADLRRASCETEVRLNRRTAPSLYLGVLAVGRREDGLLTLGGPGEPIDWVVEMVRFDQRTLFDRLAADHRLDPGMMPALADAIARLHEQAERRPDRGGRDGIAWVIDGNALGPTEQQTAAVDPDACRQLTAASKAALDVQADRLEKRRENGFVRSCHGDLHLRNICLVDGVPTVFDAVEFNERISCIDVAYDLAFLLMDLWRHDLPTHANLVFNAYLDRTGDLDALPALPLFLACRAAVSAKTSIAASRVQPDARSADRLREAARTSVVLGQAFLRPPLPILVAIGGFSGSGKTTLARGIAPAIGPAPGARIVRTDVLRKRMFGVDPLTRLGPDAYGPETSRRVYRALADEARASVQAGHAAIVDAVFSTLDERGEMARVAEAAGVRFVGLWLDGTTAVMGERLRRRSGDASDATVDVLEAQLERGAGPVEWARIDGTREAGEVCRAATAIVAPRLSGTRSRRP